MTVRWGDTGKSLNGTLKTFTHTASPARESLLGSPVALPTANPGNASAQLSFTIQQSDLPTISPAPFSVKYCVYVIVGGKNTDAASQTVYSYLYQNGTSKGNTNCSVPTNTFWTHSLYYVPSASLGDVINISMYSTSANMNYDYSYFIVLPTRILYSPSKSIMTELTISVNNDIGPTLGNPNTINSGFYYYPCNQNTAVSISVGNTSAGTIQPLNTTYNFAVSYYDNQNSAYTRTDATYRPYYRNIMYAKTVSYREIGRW